MKPTILSYLQFKPNVTSPQKITNIRVLTKTRMYKELE